MTASTMPQATALAETPPIAPHNFRFLGPVSDPDCIYRAEGLASRARDIRHLLVGIDHIQFDRVVSFAEAASAPELIDACDLIASMQVIAVEAVETMAGMADDLADALRPSSADQRLATEWDAAVARWRSAKSEADKFHALHNDSGLAREVIDEANRLDLVASQYENDVLEMPAPHFAALRFKLDHLLEDDNGALNPWTDSYVEPTRRDIARLLGEA